MTLTCHLHLDSVKAKSQAKYLGHGHLVKTLSRFTLYIDSLCVG